MMLASVESRLYGWHLALGRVEYQKVLEWQHGLVKLREQGMARDTIITVEHPPVVTLGRNSHSENYELSELEPVSIERGGDVTYHGPGQLVAYFIFNLTRRGRDLHKFMSIIQDGIIQTLSEEGIKARKDESYTGVWVGDKKIASVGIAVKKWISFHGVAFNLNTNLDEFEKMRPCGLDPKIMTSLQTQLGREIDMASCCEKLIRNYEKLFDTMFSPIDLDSIAEDVDSQAGGNEV